MITPTKRLIFALVAGSTLTVQAAEIVASIEGSANERRTVALHARRIDGVGMLERSLAAPGTTEVPLPEGLWEVTVADDGLWAPPVHVRNVDSVAVRMWPAVALEGTSKGVTELRARFTPLRAGDPAGEVTCSVAVDSWTCRIPEGRYDLRFASHGVAPEFRFGITVPSEPVALRFVPGASLHGRVEAARGSELSVEGVEVALTPANASGSEARQVTRTDRKGFFQFRGLTAGEYSVSAGKKRLVAQTRSVKILTDVAAEVRSPLVLDTPKRLSVLVMPPKNPSGGPWSIRLSASDPHSTVNGFEGVVSGTGEWSITGLVAGQYDVQVLGPEGGLWISQTVTIDSEDVTLGVAALAMKITGRITLGKRPLRAQLSFGGEDGPKVHSDDEGRFEGDIPPSEDEEREVFVEADTPAVRRFLRAKIERTESGQAGMSIDLPETTLMGFVLKEDRTPAAYAILTVTADDVFEQALTRSDGSFQIAGLDPGAYRITATAFERASRPVSVDLKKNELTEVELLLQKEAVLRGRMTMGNTPVIAAEIHALPRDAWGPAIPFTTTNERGMFRLALPPGTTIFDGIANHPAFAIVIARGTVKAEREVWVQASQLGGTIVVETPRPNEILLMHKGAEIHVQTLANLAGGMEKPGEITLPRLEPGEYAACSTDKKTCASGYLAPYGRLTLTPDGR